MTVPLNAGNTADAEVEVVAAALLALDPTGDRVAGILRNTIDQLYDGQRTGRYRWDQLYKTEKTHCGTLVEINLQREFKFEDGKTLDYRIADIEVDCKFSQKLGGWMIPPEARGHICMVVWAEDTATPHWSLGLVRITPGHLSAGSNRDAKGSLNKDGRAAIRWLWTRSSLPPNVLLQLDEESVQKIMCGPSGQRRVCDLFRYAQRRIVGRSVVATVAQQDDYMKRVRANGGARTKLQPEGIIILGHYRSHGDIAEALGLPRPIDGASISARITPATTAGQGVALIGKSLWKLAGVGDPIVVAPILPGLSQGSH